MIDYTHNSFLLISDKVPFATGTGAFTIADFGTYDGGVSMPLIRDCIGNSDFNYCLSTE